MGLTLSITGMDRETEAAVIAAFKIANIETGDKWTLLEGDAGDHVVVDMDSLYGPMSWLRLHAAGRKVIGLTSLERSQTDYRLPYPINASDLTVLLSEIATDAPGEAASPVQQDAVDAPPAASTPAPQPADQLSGPQDVGADVTEQAPAEAPAMASIAAMLEPAPEPEPVPEPESEPVPEPEPALPPERPLYAWLADGDLPGRVRIQREDGPVLLVDLANKTWHGPATLKSVAPYFQGTYLIEDFAQPGDDAWNTEASTLGAAQPLSRLQWLGGLASGQGALLSGLDPDGQYRLLKWPQTEREYPKHFRIATAMMKGPATLAEVAEASGVSREDVADFVNANLATGYAEHVLPAAPQPEAPPAKSGGLFGRIRGR